MARKQWLAAGACAVAVVAGSAVAVSVGSTVAASPADAGATTSQKIVVDQAGTGDFTTVQAAVDSIPDGNQNPVAIVVDPGRYHELVSVPAGKTHITMAGATGNPDDVTITFDNASGTPIPGGGGAGYGTEGSATVTLSANDFTASGITFENAFDPAAHPGVASQAVALRTVADRIAFYRCRFLGRQDTLYLDATSKTDTDRVYVRDSEIAGTVDFIFGPATAVFDHDTINSLGPGGGYVTAASTQLSHPHGFLFTGSQFVNTNAPDGSYNLGRPWHHLGDTYAVAQVVVRDSVLGSHIKAEPWTDMAGWSWAAARYYEYHNTGPGASVSLFRPQLSDVEATRTTPADYLLGTDRWIPWTYSEGR